MKTFTLRLLPLLPFAAGVTLWAADVWVAKPYTDWDQKDLQKIMSDSPWVKKVSVTLSGAPGGGGPGGGGGGKGVADPGISGGGGGGIAESGGGGGRGGRGGGGGGGGGDTGGGGGGGAPETELTIRWQSAAVIQEALVKAQYGAETATNADAQKRLTAEQMFYVIWVSGMPGQFRPRDDDSKKTLLDATTLIVKGKEPIVATEVVFPDPTPGRGARVTDAHFLFPRKTALSSDDKEVEFATKLGKTNVKTKFNLKSMVVNGKLGL